MSDRSDSRRVSLRVESLEAREVPAQVGNPWADPTHLTLSFARDGASALGVPSTAHASLRGSLPTALWQQAVLQAVQAWSRVANINVGLVGDVGGNFGAPGPAQ